MKKEGHSHTEFCPHGSGEDTELFILEAIKQNFDEYSITEHAPLPKEFLHKAAGAQYAIDTAGIKLSEIEPYLKKMNDLKKKYADQIHINVGFEVDFLPEYQQWTSDFLNEYGKYMDDSILSVHFLKGNGGDRAIDYSGQDYDEGIVSYYGSFQYAQEIYLQTVIDSVEADLGKYKPKRIGHITLCQKFQKYFDTDTSISQNSYLLIDFLLKKMSEKQYELDCNMAGLYKELCGVSYPPRDIVAKAQHLGIPIVYGSDSHKSNEVGRGYEQYTNFLLPVNAR